ncbi:MAG: NAD(P)/FAD-dependent oxidoreductase [Clostridia bacterium]|nr:NAD(P)/FAD-dependent oxidoreductase [Clostridia bacterium]
MEHPVLIIGGGMAGLTAAAFVCQAGRKVILFEKQDKVGGLVNSFEYQGFTFDGGIRAIENSGIVRPMLRQLGLEIPFIKNGVSIGIKDQVIRLKSEDSLADYLDLLQSQFPENKTDIETFGQEIQKIMGYMDVLYGIDNPLFLDLKNNPRYLVQTILPWLLKYLWTMPKIARLGQPVGEYLQQISKNQALIDMIAQHFFQATPTFFALSYFSLYLDYQYPNGGTGVLAETLQNFILEHGGEIRRSTEICKIDPLSQQVLDGSGQIWDYQDLIWCADLKLLYAIVNESELADANTRQAIAKQRQTMADKSGGDSILTLYLAVDLNPDYFASIANPHFFYTPRTTGLTSLQPVAGSSREEIEAWISDYLDLTTFEISCPAMRDPSLAPPGQTGLIISTLFDYQLVRKISENGWYESFKEICARKIIAILDQTIYPGLAGKVIHQIVATPLTLQRLTGNTDGAITGWAFTNQEIPAIHSMPKIAQSVLTPIPHVYQAGQWTYSPSGLPISILTGKLAADQIVK